MANKISTAVVDHGNAAAASAGYQSTQRSQKRDRGHVAIVRSIE
ncbi:hypothetical protein [Bradyrhizobium sp. RDM4]